MRRSGGQWSLHPTSVTRGMHRRSGLPSAGKGVCVVFKDVKISLDFFGSFLGDAKKNITPLSMQKH